MKKGISVLLAALMALGGPALAAEDAVPELIEPVGVKLDTATAVRQDIFDLKYYDAAVVPYTEELSFTVDGEIESVSAIAGDIVKQGDVLATLNQDALTEQADSLREQIEYSEAMLAFAEQQDRLELSMAQLELERMRAQLASGEVTQAQFRLRQADVNILRTSQQQAREIDAMSLTALKEELERVEAELGNNVITAPFDGRLVYMRQVKKGSYVKAYDPMFYIADDTRLSVDSAYITSSSLESANAVYARIGDTDYAVVEQEFDWQEYVSIALSGGELRTRFDFAEGVDTEGLESGMYACVFLKTGLVEDALVIPSNALYSDATGRYVYKMEGDTRVRTHVTTGRITASLAQITEGLEEGDLVYIKE